jgi:DNA repair photolyase
MFICSAYVPTMPTLLDMRASVAFDTSLKARPMPLPQSLRGRGTRSNVTGRYERQRRALVDDGWETLAELAPLKTTVFEENPKSIIARNDSPDINFDRSINPYRGCEHGCVYCYARPTHAYMGLSPGLDFESKLFIKPNAAALLREELTAPNYIPRTIALGANTDPYQPIERTYRLTRQVLEVLSEFNHPVGIVTKSALVLRDLDILTSMAERNLVKVALSVTTLDPRLARKMEPRASTPEKRFEALRVLSSAGIPTVLMMAPIIAAVNDMEIEAILKMGAQMGVREAGYTMLRLPLEVKDLFKDWLDTHMPDRAQKVMAQVRSIRGGKENDANFGTRMTGTGPYAWMTGRRFQLTCEKLGINQERVKLRTDLFTKPERQAKQLTLI